MTNALVVVDEIGADQRRFPSSNRFTSWLVGVGRGTDITGSNVMSGLTYV